MSRSIKSILNKFGQENPPEHLYTNIVNILTKRALYVRRIKLLITGLLSVFSLVSVGFGSVWVFEGFKSSGFFYYLSLISSDLALLVPSWKEFAMTLVESLPVFGLTVIFVGIFSLLEAINIVMGVRRRNLFV